MATLPTILINGDATSPRNWTTQSYLDVDEGISSADGNYASALDQTDNNDTAFLIANMPTDFQSMDSLSWQVRWRTNVARDNDLNSLQIRIVNGATILAAGSSGGAFQTVVSNTGATTWQNTSVTAFTYVNTSANKAAWDGAQVELRQTYTKEKGPDASQFWVDTLEFTGTYAAVIEAAVSENVDLTATEAVVATFEPSVSETVDLTESANALGSIYEPALSAAVDLTEANDGEVAGGTVHEVSVTENVDLTATEAADVTFEASLTETVDLTESQSNTVDFDARLPGAVLIDRSVAFYRFEEASGTRADSHTGGYDLDTIVGTPGNATGIVGNALSLAQNDEVKASGANEPPTPSTAFGARGWIRINGAFPDNNDRIFRWGQSGGRGFALAHYGFGVDAFKLTRYGTRNYDIGCCQTVGYSLGTWYYVVIEAWPVGYNGDPDGGVRLRVYNSDGTLFDDESDNNGGDAGGVYNPFLEFVNFSSSASCVTLFDSWELFEGLMSEGEIQYLINGGSGQDYSDLTGQVPLISRLSAFYRLDDDGTWADSLGRQVGWSETGTITTRTGKHGLGADFPDYTTNNGLDIANASAGFAQIGNGPWSLAFWFEADNLPPTSYGNLIRMGGGSDTNEGWCAALRNNGGTLQAYFFVSDGTTRNNASVTPLSTATKYLFVADYQDAGGTNGIRLRIYNESGTQVGSTGTAADFGSTHIGAADTMKMGRDFVDDFDGLIDSVAFFPNHLLTDAEVKLILNGGDGLDFPDYLGDHIELGDKIDAEVSYHAGITVTETVELTATEAADVTFEASLTETVELTDTVTVEVVVKPTIRIQKPRLTDAWRYFGRASQDDNPWRLYGHNDPSGGLWAISPFIYGYGKSNHYDPLLDQFLYPSGNAELSASEIGPVYTASSSSDTTCVVIADGDGTGDEPYFFRGGADKWSVAVVMKAPTSWGTDETPILTRSNINSGTSTRVRWRVLTDGRIEVRGSEVFATTQTSTGNLVGYEGEWLVFFMAKTSNTNATLEVRRLASGESILSETISVGTGNTIGTTFKSYLGKGPTSNDPWKAGQQFAAAAYWRYIGLVASAREVYAKDPWVPFRKIERPFALAYAGGPVEASVTENIDLTATEAAVQTTEQAVAETVDLAATEAAELIAEVAASATVELAESVSALGSVYEVSVSEAVDLAETTDADVSKEAALSETVDLSDAWNALGSTYEPALSEAVDLAATEAGEQVTDQSLSEAVDLAATEAADAVYETAATEAVDLTESVNALGSVYEVSVSETVELTETADAIVTKETSVTETVDLAATEAADATFEPSLSEAVELTATTTALGSTYETAVSEAVDLAATEAAVQTTEQSVSEQVDLTDTYAEDTAIETTVSEQVDLTESVSALGSTYEPALSEQVDLAATETAAQVTEQALSEAVDLTATEAGVKVTDDSLSEQVDLSDTVDGSVAVVEAELTETVELTATEAAVATLEPAATETVELTESVSALGSTYEPALSEAVDLTAAEVGEQTTEQSLSETVDLTESIAADVSIEAALSEAVDLAESTSALGSVYEASVTETVELTASASAAGSVYEAAVSEAVEMTAAESATFVTDQSVSEAVDLTDAVAGDTAIEAALSETVELSDVFVGETPSVEVAVTETVELSDAIAAIATLEVGAAETIELLDAILSGLQLQVSVSEAVDLSGTVTSFFSGKDADGEITEYSDRTGGSLSLSGKGGGIVFSDRTTSTITPSQ